MWHDVRTVARNNFLNPEKLVEFANKNINKYQLLDDGLFAPYVSTWHADRLVKDAKEAGIERVIPVESNT